MARAMLAVPASSTPVKCLFSTSSRVMSDRRSSFNTLNLKASNLFQKLGQTFEEEEKLCTHIDDFVSIG